LACLFSAMGRESLRKPCRRTPARKLPKQEASVAAQQPDVRQTTHQTFPRGLKNGGHGDLDAEAETSFVARGHIQQEFPIAKPISTVTSSHVGKVSRRKTDASYGDSITLFKAHDMKTTPSYQFATHFKPVLPKPPAPRAVSLKLSTSSKPTLHTAEMTSCAMRSPTFTSKGSLPGLSV